MSKANCSSNVLLSDWKRKSNLAQKRMLHAKHFWLYSLAGWGSFAGQLTRIRKENCVDGAEVYELLWIVKSSLSIYTFTGVVNYRVVSPVRTWGKVLVTGYSLLGGALDLHGYDAARTATIISSSQDILRFPPIGCTLDARNAVVKDIAVFDAIESELGSLI